MKKAVITAQIALICAEIVNIARAGADALDWATLAVLSLSAVLNIIEEVYDAE